MFHTSSVLFSLFSFVLTISFLVAIHEYGHFWVVSQSLNGTANEIIPNIAFRGFHWADTSKCMAKILVRPQM